MGIEKDNTALAKDLTKEENKDSETILDNYRKLEVQVDTMIKKIKNKKFSVVK
jgi:hypothetical protein